MTPDLVIADRFRLVRPLGEGGMGAVWLATHIRLQIPCAVKFMRPEVAAEPAYRTRFDREAVAAAQIRSPHVVNILDHGVWEGAPYIAMEYLEGEDLAQRLARSGMLSPAETVRIVAQVARALTRAHAASLVHRDLKPGNIFLARDDDRELIKVLDFGIAKVSSPATGNQTKTGAILGTPYYMSPEQAQGTKTVDHRTDLWALAVVVFECLTGKLPFVSDAFGDLVLKIIVEEIPVPSRVAAVPAGFDAWWAHAVARDPAARFQSAKEMSEALADALGVPIAGEAGAPSVQATQVPAPGGPRTPAEVTPARPGVEAPGSSTVAGAATTLGSPARSRSRVLAGLSVAAAVAIGIGVVATRGSTRAMPPATAAAQPANVAAPPATSAADTRAPSPSAAPSPSTAEPVSSAAASAAPPVEASGAPVAHTAGTVGGNGPRPHGKAVSPKAPASAAPQGHDIGF
ncbi:Putative serine/threonine-protein kinase pknH [Minicystis rosea]|nr:Putative serine/threonine-protein kinase pknH [Minicystis rosea]